MPKYLTQEWHGEFKRMSNATQPERPGVKQPARLRFSNPKDSPRKIWLSRTMCTGRSPARPQDERRLPQSVFRGYGHSGGGAGLTSPSGWECSIREDSPTVDLSRHACPTRGDICG